MVERFRNRCHTCAIGRIRGRDEVARAAGARVAPVVVVADGCAVTVVLVALVYVCVNS